MELRMYSVFDVKAAVYGLPFFYARDAVAVRAFTDLVNDPSSSVNRHPEDFTLFAVGIFDDQTATISPIQPVALVTAAAVRSSGVNGDSKVTKSLSEVK